MTILNERGQAIRSVDEAIAELEKAKELLCR